MSHRLPETISLPPGPGVRLLTGSPTRGPSSFSIGHASMWVGPIAHHTWVLLLGVGVSACRNFSGPPTAPLRNRSAANRLLLSERLEAELLAANTRFEHEAPLIG
jgi:hypothetical protein